MSMPADNTLDEMDRKIILATQDGLPLVPAPYQAVAEKVGLSSEEVCRRMSRMLAEGVIRRIGLVPNHYALGYKANGMSVWDIADEDVDAAGEAVGALPFVTHCYRRPRHAPLWNYNLFAMVHGHDREEVERQVALIATLLGEKAAKHEILYSTRILKKAGLRLVNG